MESIIARVLICIIVGSVVIAAVLTIVEQHWDALVARKAENERKHRPWDPALCPHEWELGKANPCREDVAKGSDSARPQWKVDICTHCGTKRFSCENESCARYAQCRALREKDAPKPGTIERELLGRVADAHGFEYAHYRLSDRFGNSREAWCRTVPTTIAFSCPDCGGMVVGVGARRVWPGTTGEDPEAFRCEKCGRQEDHEFGVPRVTSREGEPSFVAPTGMQPVCPRGGKHEWELIDEWSELDFPEGVDACLENLSLLEQVWHERLRCKKCGEEKTT